MGGKTYINNFLQKLHKENIKLQFGLKYSPMYQSCLANMAPLYIWGCGKVAALPPRELINGGAAPQAYNYMLVGCSLWNAAYMHGHGASGGDFV